MVFLVTLELGWCRRAGEMDCGDESVVKLVLSAVCTAWETSFWIDMMVESNVGLVYACTVHVPG